MRPAYYGCAIFLCMQKWSSGDVVTAKLSLAVFDILCYNKMNYADKTKYPRTTARGEIQDVNKMGSRKPMKLNLGMAPKVIFIMMLDVLATVVSFFLGLWFRYDFSFAEIRPVHLEGFLSAIGLWCVITLLVFWIFRLYNSIWAFVSTPEVFRITGAYVVLGVIGVLVFHFDGNLMPRSSMVVGFLFSFVSTVAIRFSYRLLRTAQRRISHITHANGVKNVMLIGAGDAGRALAVEFTNSDHIQDHLSCVIDDNPVKWNKQLCGVPIVGGRQDIATAVKKYKISKIIFAIPNCTAKSRKEILDICATTGCEVQMLPGIFQMVNGEVSAVHAQGQQRPGVRDLVAPQRHRAERAGGLDGLHQNAPGAGQPGQCGEVGQPEAAPALVPGGPPFDAGDGQVGDVLAHGQELFASQDQRRSVAADL